MIDLRSDTVTKPTPEMLAAMFAAPVGDDVYAEDPSINALEGEVAAYFGKEAGLFVPSGTMSNQIAVRLHCAPGTELYCDHTSHVILWEGGGPATLSGVTVRPIVGDFGKISRHQLEELHRPDDIHSPVGRLVWLENTHNRGGGSIHSLEEVRSITAWAREHNLRTHLDGARLWNAIVATGVPGPRWAAEFDSVSVCFSKGLGAPVGSALLGSSSFIKEARRIRKLFGGAMRQAGFLAAACSFAMKHHIARLADDHASAKLIADAVRHLPGVQLVPENVETNLVWFEVDAKRHGPPQAISAKLKERGVLMSALGSKTLRAVTHLNVSREQCETAAKALREVLR